MSGTFRWHFPKYIAVVNVGWGNKDVFEIKSYASKEQMIRYTKGYNATVYEHNGTDYIKLP